MRAAVTGIRRAAAVASTSHNAHCPGHLPSCVGPGQEACIKSDREASAQSGLVCRKASRTGDGSSPPGELYEQARVGEHALSVDTTPARSAPPPATPSGSGAPAEPGNVTPVVRALHKVEEGDEDCGEEAEQPDGEPALQRKSAI